MQNNAHDALFDSDFNLLIDHLLGDLKTATNADPISSTASSIVGFACDKAKQQQKEEEE